MVIRPREFSGVAAQWGSYMTAGDPGACMYGFGDDGLPQSEEHRQQCLAYIEDHCRAAADANVAAGDDPTEQHPQLDDIVAYLKSAPLPSTPDLDAFTEAYIKAALFSTSDESNEAGGDPLDSNYGVQHISAASLEVMKAECALFQEYYGDLFTEENCSYRGCPVEEYAAHDFWLTRNAHGAGFWDGDWEEPAATLLTEAARSFGECDLYVGDDGLIHTGSSEPSRPDKVEVAARLRR